MNSKPVLVFIPGWGADYRVWSGLSDVLSAHFEIKYIDLMSDAKLMATLAEIKANNATLDCVVDRIAGQIPDKSVVIGWSLGGMLATSIASRFKGKVSQLILIASNVSFVQRPDWSAAMDLATFDQFVSSFQNDPDKTRKRFIALQAQGINKRKALSARLNKETALSEENKHHALQLLNLLGEIDNRKELAELKISVLMFFGENDALVPLVAAEEIKVLLKKQSSEENNCIELISECGHVPQVSHAEIILKKIHEFLRIRDMRFSKDKKKIANSFSKASTSYDKFAGLQREVANELMLIAGDAEGCVADLGCGTGFCIDVLVESQKNVKQIVGVDIAQNMLLFSRDKNRVAPCLIHYCLADIENLPFEKNSLDWAVSSLAVQWCESLHHMFTNVAASLKDTGCFALSSLGPQTLHELNSAWLEADAEHVHVNQFFSNADVIEAAESAGFELDLMKIEFKTLQYKNVIDLMRDLKGIGAHNINNGINKGLTGKRTLNALTGAYENYRSEKGELPATYEVQYWLFKKKRVLK